MLSATSWLRPLHVIGIILWMGGLFQLARHLGDHADLEDASARDAFADYESKTYYMIVLPGFLLTLATGLTALFKAPGAYLNADGAWGATFHLKLLLVAILIGIDQFLHFKMRKLHDSGEGARGLFMGLHGTVGLLFIVIVIIVQTRVMA